MQNTTEPPTPATFTEIAVILDRSGSMQSIVSDAIGGFNAFLAAQRREPGHARLSLVLFDDQYEVPLKSAPLTEVPALTARPSGTPVTYQVEVRHGTDVEQKWSGAMGAGRVSARIVTARRDAVREFLAADGALLLDDGVFHQYVFLARRRS